MGRRGDKSFTSRDRVPRKAVSRHLDFWGQPGRSAQAALPVPGQLPLHGLFGGGGLWSQGYGIGGLERLRNISGIQKNSLSQQVDVGGINPE